MNLYDISSRYQQLLDQDEYTEEDLQELNSLHGSVEEGITSRAKYIKNLEAEQDAIDNAITLMEERSEALEKKIANQRERLASYMSACQIKEVKTPYFNIKYVINRASTDIFDSKLIPDQFVTYVEVQPQVKISKDEIKKAIENGQEVPGARLIYNVKVDIK